MHAPVRDAASIILMRRADGEPQVLMGQRGAAAIFMPDKFVFPGGAVDPEDIALGLDPRLEKETFRRLRRASREDVARALPFAAIRELWEETGLMLGRPDPQAAELATEASGGWRGFLSSGHLPDCGSLRFIFRAITPPGRPRRFDARFFLADARGLAGSPDDMTAVSGELLHLEWLGLARARGLSLPFITEVVLSELEAILAEDGAPRPVPFFEHSEEGSHFRLL